MGILVKVYENIRWNDVKLEHSPELVFDKNYEQWKNDEYVQYLLSGMDYKDIPNNIKTLIYLYKTDENKYVPVSKLRGCWKLVNELGKHKDILLYDNEIPVFYGGDCEFQFENGVIINNIVDYAKQRQENGRK